ncbi:hypothetical protein QT972_24395 [Microcoleus sp. herbarium7]|uniref:hypothetical protein n=1 Tax=Microcoleus sp. herbarium7 TaxID=3055435 RepID=UPI002FCF00F7
MEIAKFNSPEDAIKVEAHLRGVKIVGSELHHTKFDRAALSLAARLEGLTQNDYQICNNFVKHQTDSPWFDRPPVQAPRITLEVALTVAILSESGDAEVVGVHVYRLAVFSSFLIDGAFTEIQLTVNAELVRFANMVQHNNTEDITEDMNISEIDVVCCRVDDFRNPSQYHLVIRGDGRSQTIRFYPGSVSLNVS